MHCVRKLWPRGETTIDRVYEVKVHAVQWPFGFSSIASCLTSFVIWVVPEAVHRLAKRGSQGGPAAEFSTSITWAHSDWSPAFEFMADVSASNCGAMDAQLDDIVLGVHSLSIAKVLAVAEKIW